MLCRFDAGNRHPWRVSLQVFQSGVIHHAAKMCIGCDQYSEGRVEIRVARQGATLCGWQSMSSSSRTSIFRSTTVSLWMDTNVQAHRKQDPGTRRRTAVPRPQRSHQDTRRWPHHFSKPAGSHHRKHQVSSGLNVTVESECGFPLAVLRASLGDAHRDRRQSDRRGP
jgi:hypothetical protein